MYWLRSVGGGLFIGLVILSANGGSAQSSQSEEEARTEQREQRFKDLWNTAKSPHMAGDYAQSAALHKQLLEEFPDSQRARLRLAIAQENIGEKEKAFTNYDKVVEMDPDGDWTTFALFYKARAAKKADQSDDALEAISKLQSLHPDSPFTARANLLKNKIEGGEIGKAQANLERELDAAHQYEAAMNLQENGKNQEALSELKQVIQDYPNAAVRMRAQEAAGHILIKQGEHEKALDYFLKILDNVVNSAPESRISRTAQERIGAIFHVLGDRETALGVFDTLYEHHSDSPQAANAYLQAGGLKFELLQRRVINEKDLPSDDEWTELRNRFSQIHSIESTTPQQEARADLMILETLNWQNHYQETAERFPDFIKKYGDQEDLKQEVDTARFFAAGANQKVGKYDEALKLYSKLIDGYSVDKPLWEGMRHYQLALMGRWQCLRKSDASPDKIADAAQQILDEVPESDFARHVKLALGTREEWTEKVNPQNH